MAWFVLLASAVLEAIWATALSYSDGLTDPVPTVVFLVTTTASVVGLGWAMKYIPTGTAYATWTGVGAVLTVAWAAITGAEPLSPLKVLFLVAIIGCVAALTGASQPDADDKTPEAA